MNYQPAIEGMPEEEETTTIHWGLLYICIGDNRVIKIGRSATTKGMQRRVTDHRKHEPTIQLACHKLVPHVTTEEANLIRYLKDHGAQVSGTKEWFYFDAYLADRIIDYMSHRGADIEHMEREMARIIGLHAHRGWAVG